MIRFPAAVSFRQSSVGRNCLKVLPASCSSASSLLDFSGVRKFPSNNTHEAELCNFGRQVSTQALRDASLNPVHHQGINLGFINPLLSYSTLSPTNATRFKSTLSLNGRSGNECENETGEAKYIKGHRCEYDSSFEPISVPDFDDPNSAHGSKTTTELARGILVYQLCRIQPLVDNAESIMNISSKIFGNRLTDMVMKATFFKHFCAGEDIISIQPAIHKMKRYGIGGILDYAAENDGDSCITAFDEENVPDDNVPENVFDQPVRVYDYVSEKQCDRHVETFLKCIRAVKDVSPEGFAAVKVTALGNPILLERMSNAITEAKNLYAKFDDNGDGVVSREDFARGYRIFFDNADERLDQLLDLLDPNEDDKVDYIEWSKLLEPSDLPAITANCREIGPLSLATPSSEEIKLIEAMRRRLYTLAEEAAYSGVRLLIDAEHHKFQAAIDNLTIDLQHKYNSTDRTKIPIIFNTYQCYLKDTPERMMIDVERSKRNSYHFATKLVRGAYINYERERAAELNLPDPIHPTIEDTHKCYNECLEYLIRYRVENGVNLEVMCATHNQQSIVHAINLMNKYGIRPSDSAVYFAQLFGMCDNLTYTLGRNGFSAYKYVPYGLVHEVMPYLMRRAQENSGMMGNNTTKELALLKGEIRRRLLRR